MRRQKIMDIETHGDNRANNDDGEKDLYRILNLDESKVRKRPHFETALQRAKRLHEQDRIITRAYRQLMLRHHPDRNPDSTHACDINMAYSILRNREQRAMYHDLRDFKKGMRGRLRAVLFPETDVGTSERAKRILCSLAILGLGVGGVVLSFALASLCFPVLLVVGSVGSGAISAAIHGGKRLFSIDTIKHGINVENFMKSLLVGGVSGVATGLVTGGIGYGLSFLDGAVISGVEELFCYLEEMAFLDKRFIKALHSIESDHHFVPYLTFGAATSAVGGAMGAVASNIDGALIDGDYRWKQIALDALKGAVSNLVYSTALRSTLRPIRNAVPSAIPDSERHCEIAESGIVNVADNMYSLIDSPRDSSRTEVPASVPAFYDIYGDSTVECRGSNEDGYVEYSSTGLYLTRMILKYTYKEKRIEKTAEGSGSRLDIPGGAENIEVRFQAMRFIKKWCDVKKWHRFDERWFKPTEPHVFRFKTSVKCRFTLGGTLYFEGVVKITNDDDQFVNIME